MAGDDTQNWDHYLQHSSALGILRPDAVFDVFGGGPQQDAPSIRLVRTAHAADGLSFFAEDDYLVASLFPGGADGASFAYADRRSVVPVRHPANGNVGGGGSGGGSPSSGSSSSSAAAASASSASTPRVPSSGAAFVLCDIPAYRVALPMRRTLALEYVVVLAGSVSVCLDSGDEKTVHAGEIVVQQGTCHAWVNRTGAPCRLLCVMLAGRKITLPDGTVLDKSG